MDKKPNEIHENLIYMKLPTNRTVQTFTLQHNKTQTCFVLWCAGESKAITSVTNHFLSS